MSDWVVPFIGREEEIELIEKQLLLWDTRRVIFISGEGGIGKTRLLNEMGERFIGVEDIPLKILSIVDFDDDRYKIPQNIGASVAQQLDPDTFNPYLEALRQLRWAEEKSAEQGSAFLTRRILAIDRTFAECFNIMSKKQRIVLRMDTFDAMQDTMQVPYLFEMAFNLQNVLILAAGRDADQLYEKYGQELGTDATLLQLSPFLSDDSLSYLKQKQEILKITLAPTWMDKLFVLAGGLPVLIDLAIEWAQNHRSLPWMDELLLSELEDLQQKTLTGDIEAKQRLEDLQEKFKQEVVMPLADLTSNLDHLKLILAKVYPLDTEGVAEMLNISQDETTQLFEQIKTSVAIKTLPDKRIKLHDEVQRLINTYVWPHLDPNQEWEVRDSKRAINYLARRSDALLDEVRQLKQQEQELIDALDPSLMLEIFSKRRNYEQELWSLRVERLRRQLAIGVQSGYELFQQEFELARVEGSSINYRQGLLTVIEPYAELDSQTGDIYDQLLLEDQKHTIQYILAREATFEGAYNQAAKIYQRLLARVTPDSEEYIAIRNGQANQLIRAGKLQEALRINEQVLKIAEQLGSEEWKVKGVLEVGWTHRLMGHLGQAQKYYNDALRLAFEYDDEERIALIYNSLAYVHALQQQDKALNKIEMAIQLWRKLAQVRAENYIRLGQCYNTAGEIHIELAYPEKALSFFELSLNIFNREDIIDWKSKARSGRGFARWQMAQTALLKGDRPSVEEYLKDALQDLEWALEHSTEIDGPITLNRLGEIHFLLKDYQPAEKNWKQGMSEARQVGDARSELRSLSNLARLTFYHTIEQFSDWQSFEHHYRRDYRRRYQTHFEHLVGLFYVCLGNLALKGKDVESAIRLYERGLPILAQTGSYSPFNLTGQLNFIQQEVLPVISPQYISELGETLKKMWIDGAHDVIALSYFRDWINWDIEPNKTSRGQHA